LGHRDLRSNTNPHTDHDFSQLGPATCQSTKKSDIKYKWDGKVLLLRPTVDEWEDFPTLLSYAQGLGAEKVGAFKVEVPKALRYDVPQTQTDNSARNYIKYRAQPLKNGAYRVELIPTTAFFRSSPSSLHDSSSAEQAVEYLEELLQSNQKLDGVYYRTDIPVCDSAKRAAAGLPDKYIIWPRRGDQLPHTKYKVPGLHSPYYYESAEKFGAVFGCHLEDCYLHSINQLHMGRKIWVVIPPVNAEAFERILKSSDKSIATDCA
jgi:jumonji domain-containing protein 2